MITNMNTHCVGLWVQHWADVNTAAVSAGYVREKHFYLSPKAKWNAANCDVVVWVYNADSKEVVQVEKVALK